MNASRRGAFILVSLLAHALACLEPTVEATCVDDQACPGGTVCAFGLCVDPSALAAVDVEVEPVVASGLPAQAVFGVASDTGARVDVTLAPAVSVRGGVVAVDDGGVGATVTAVPERSIAGRRRQPSTTTADGPFTLALVEGAAYRVQALPTERDLPPILPDDVFVAGVDDVPALVMSSTRGDGGVVHPVTVRGQLVAGIGVAAQPISELEVLLLDGDGRRVSSLGVTDIDGRFEVGLAERYPDVRFVARRSEQNALSPTLEFPLDLGPDAVVDLGVVSLGTSLGVVRVEGEVRTTSGAPAEGAVVSFRGLIGAGVAEARTETIDGRFSVSLHPGSYSVAVVGAVAGTAGLVVTTLDVAQDERDLLITLPERVAANFTVSSAAGGAVGLASVVLTRVGDEDGVAEPVLAAAQPVFLGSSDEDGRVAFAVDPGRYRIAIQPPRGVEAPTFSTLITVGEAGVDRDVELPASTIMAGTLRDGAGGAVVGAFVRVFSSLTDELGRAIFLGEGLSGADGTFEVYVPAP
jgi:hypothetical protein